MTTTIVFSLADATPAALFGMFALWAATSRRHWFIRTAVVGAAILVVLLIPAFEVVIQFSIECLLIIAGLAWWRQKRNHSTFHFERLLKPWQFRVSLETLMLMVVLIAVPTAVISKASGIAAYDWYGLILSSVLAAATVLACVWIVYGNSRLWLRIAAIPFLVVAFAAMQVCLSWAGSIFKHWWYAFSGPLSDYVLLALRDSWPSIKSWMPTTALGIFIVTVWLLLMRRAQWFDPFDDLPARQTVEPKEPRRGIAVARLATFLWFGVVSLFPLFLLAALLRRTPIPIIELPQPNGYDDFIAAGRMIGPTSAGNLRAFDQLTPQALATEVAAALPALQRVQDGLKKDCWSPYGYKSIDRQEWLALCYVTDAYCGQAALARQNGDEQLLLRNDLTYLRLSIAVGRGVAADGIINDVFYQYEPDVVHSIWELSNHFSPGETRQVVTELMKIDSEREAWDVLADRQRTCDANNTWQRHLSSLLQQWSGHELRSWNRQEYLRRVTQMRMLILKLAARVYESEKGHRPAAPKDLIPAYLSEIPNDPFDSGPMKYRVVDDSYVLYSVGLNGIDDGGSDGGTPVIGDRLNDNGDLTEGQLFPVRPQN